jgi:WD40 repeat protein
LWDLTSGRVVQTLPGSYVQEWNQGDVVFSPNGRFLAASIAPEGISLPTPAEANAREILLVDLPAKASRRLKGHTNGITCLAFSSDSAQLASGGFDDTVRVWSTLSGEEAASPFGP